MSRRRTFVVVSRAPGSTETLATSPWLRSKAEAMRTIESWARLWPADAPARIFAVLNDAGETVYNVAV